MNKQKIFNVTYLMILLYIFISETILKLGFTYISFVFALVSMFFVDKELSRVKVYLLLLFPLFLWIIRYLFDDHIFILGGVIFVKLVQTLYLCHLYKRDFILLKVVKVIIALLYVIPAFMFSAAPAPQEKEAFIYCCMTIFLVLSEFGLTFIESRKRLI